MSVESPGERMETMLDLKIVHRTLIRSDPESVYDALTTGEGFDSWFTRGSEIDARPGGSYVFRWRGWGPDKTDGDRSGPVIDAQRPSRYVFQWNEHLGQRTTVAFALDAVPDGTVVTVTETGYPDTPDGRFQIMDCAVGWGEALTLLKFWIEHGVRY
ncbi:MAG: hypothetical protein AVDCRST_MAG33-325 [uncultured Thermomicrobiales bacterium]|uniref:Activator of Hsp90 ATPase homologue 1/2-like C-terminal domain-containing protein n=1 Tax=uncultured Thermomicrobiales bacterium TaxID=1645740 RepID=A0A6J4U9J9_9BACT|nr:MAG: hypothetical protein AVDCRST_MAG33-325 [uncultured Thermomicrobiales bacterium]